MPSINVDFEVWKELTAKRKDESDTDNDVLRRLLSLGDAKPSQTLPDNTQRKRAHSIGGDVPFGTRLRKRHMGRLYVGEVTSRGYEVNGKVHQSPSGAACYITKTKVNGWTWWDCLLPDETQWRELDYARSVKHQNSQS